MMCLKVKPAVRRTNLFCNESCINTSIIITTHEMMQQRVISRLLLLLSGLWTSHHHANSSYKFTFSAAKTTQVQRFAAALLVGGCDHKILTVVLQRAFLRAGLKLNHQVPYCVWLQEHSSSCADFFASLSAQAWFLVKRDKIYILSAERAANFTLFCLTIRCYC